ncbi:MFS general substrate transporter [Diplogelasinospora grovesii]|uniref:MFS general substrate transporter n=1 Tax=Diplogelasinospora grovesii TaxID=303347 RepID=A0AAN6NDM8_9PEZI|nr:MFS general substrate transporter [Diplogelasinospora grovesii]
MATTTNITEDDTFSTAATATESTPLLGSSSSSSSSSASSTHTTNTAVLRDDGSSSPSPSEQAIGVVSSPPPTPEESISYKRGAAILLSMWALVFLQASNMSGITTTQSTIAADLDAYEYAMWFTSSYLITMASVAPVVGRLAMIFSPGAMILFSSFFFSLGAIITSQARSFGVFILGRVLIGVGGGGIMTLALILVIQLTGKKRRGLWIGVTNAGFTIGLSTGAIVFGALLPVIGWRALFWIQCPIGLLAGVGVYLSMPHFAKMSGNGKHREMSTMEKLKRIDYAGALALTLTIVLFLYGLSGTTIQLLPIALSLITLPTFIIIEMHYTTDPIIPLTVLFNRGILLSCLSQLGFMAARWTVLFYAPVFVLAVRGLSPAVAGSILIPTNLGFGSGGLIVGWLHIRRSGAFWLPSLISLFLFGCAILGISFVSNAAAPTWIYLGVIFFNGLCTGAALNYTLAHLLHLSSPEMHFIVTGLLSTFRGFAGSFGTAIGGGIFGRTLRDALTQGFIRLDGGTVLKEGRDKLITVLIGSPAVIFGYAGSMELSEQERAVAVAGYEYSLKRLYQAAAMLSILVLAVQAGTGRKGPVTKEEEEEIEEEVAQHDGAMEA